MKKITTILILIISLGLNAQDYFSNNPQWRQHSTCNFGGCLDIEEYVYYLNGDSIVNNLTYKKIFKRGELHQSPLWPPPSYNCDDNYTFNNFRALIRQEGLKIYIKEYEDSDTLLYDFNLNIGDTLPKTWNQSHDDYIISSIDSILVGNSIRKVFYFETMGDYVLIEGIGHSDGLLEPFPPILECGHNLYCFALNDTTYFPEYGAPCDLTVDIIENPYIETISLSPNPTDDHIVINSSNYTEILEIVFYTQTGQKALTIKAPNSTIDISNLKPGYTLLR